MHSVPAKVAEEVLMLLEDADPAACSCEEQSGHYARGPPADVDQVRFAIRRHAVTALQPWRSNGNEVRP